MTDTPSAAAQRLLGAAADPRGRSPRAWAVDPIRAARRVLDLGCGFGSLADELAGEWIGVDAEVVPGRQPRVRGSAMALPIATNAVDAVCLFLTLPLLAAVDTMFAEIRRVLQPAGMLVVVSPSVVMRTIADLRLARVLRPVRRGDWPNRAGLDDAGWLLAAADFAVMGDDRVPFAVPLPDAAAAVNAVAELPAAGLWPPGLPVETRQALADELTARAGPGQLLPVPLRRLVARR